MNERQHRRIWCCYRMVSSVDPPRDLPVCELFTRISASPAPSLPDQVCFPAWYVKAFPPWRISVVWEEEERASRVACSEANSFSVTSARETRYMPVGDSSEMTPLNPSQDAVFCWSSYRTQDAMVLPFHIPIRPLSGVKNYTVLEGSFLRPSQG